MNKNILDSIKELAYQLPKYAISINHNPALILNFHEIIFKNNLSIIDLIEVRDILNSRFATRDGIRYLSRDIGAVDDIRTMEFISMDNINLKRKKNIRGCWKRIRNKVNRCN